METVPQTSETSETTLPGRPATQISEGPSSPPPVPPVLPTPPELWKEGDTFSTVLIEYSQHWPTAGWQSTTDSFPFVQSVNGVLANSSQSRSSSSCLTYYSLTWLPQARVCRLKSWPTLTPGEAQKPGGQGLSENFGMNGGTPEDQWTIFPYSILFHLFPVMS